MKNNRGLNKKLLLDSKSCVDTHQELEAIFNAYKQVLSVINLNVEFSLKLVVDEHTSFNTNLVTL